jgi:hypothetical protein
MAVENVELLGWLIIGPSGPYDHYTFTFSMFSAVFLKTGRLTK